MANTRLPYFPFYVRDFVSDGKVESMSTLAVGSYILLLCKAWCEDPPASIPDADHILARWARLDLDQWMAIKAEVLAAFTLGPDSRWHQKRLRYEYNKLMTSINNKSACARKAAKSRWTNKKDADALPVQSRRKADDMHGGYVYASEFESLWSSYPEKDGKKKAFSSFRGSVKTPSDLQAIQKALKNYLQRVEIDRNNGFQRRFKNGAAWFNSWHDWLEPPSVEVKSFSGPNIPI